MKATREFNALLRDCNVQAAYEDVTGRRRRASVDALLSLLQSLGIEIEKPDQATEILRVRQHARYVRGIEPVHVAWNGAPRPISITLPATFGGGEFDYRLECGPKLIERSVRFESLPLSAENGIRSSDFVSRMLPLPGDLPSGYHKLRLMAEGRIFEAIIISTPRKAFVRGDAQAAANKRHRSNGEARRDRRWGIFLPLYALRTRRDWGVGDFTDLGELMDWVGGLGASD
ncbi:MAG TPA: hypothetical protein VGK58_10855, partial [Lacipirellulaceae bacterium]